MTSIVKIAALSALLVCSMVTPQAVETCIYKGEIFYYYCPEEELDVIVDFDLGIKFGPIVDDIKDSRISGLRSPLATRLGIGHYPTKLMGGLDMRLNPFAALSQKHDRDIGVYVKYDGLAPIELSGHYMIETLRSVEAESNSNNVTYYRGFGVGLSAGWDLLVVNLRTDITYHQFLEKVSNEESIPLPTNQSPGGFSVSFIVALPFQFNIGL